MTDLVDVEMRAMVEFHAWVFCMQVLVVDLSTSNAEVEDAGAVRSQSMALGDHPSERTQDQNPADEHLARAESLQGHPPRP